MHVYIHCVCDTYIYVRTYIYMRTYIYIYTNMWRDTNVIKAFLQHLCIEMCAHCMSDNTNLIKLEAQR